jgi:hypothetical protein
MLLVPSNEDGILVNVRSAVEVEVNSADVIAEEDVFKASDEFLFGNLLKELDLFFLFIEVILLRSYLSPSSSVNFSYGHVFFHQSRHQ